MEFSQFKVFFSLVRRDMIVYRPTLKGRTLNMIIWGSLCTGVFEYLIPIQNSLGYGPFIGVGIMATCGFFEVTEDVTKFISDIEGNRSVSYYLTLPISHSMLFVRMAISNALQAFCTSLLLFPCIKIILWNSLTFEHFSLWKFLVIFPLIHIFYGSFSLIIANNIESLDVIGNVWMRFVLPMWRLGCFEFSWYRLYDFSPKLAYISLLNPIVYSMEGLRNAMLGGSGYLSFLNCVGMLIFLTFLTLWIGVRGLKKRLDCI